MTLSIARLVARRVASRPETDETIGEKQSRTRNPVPRSPREQVQAGPRRQPAHHHSGEGFQRQPQVRDLKFDGEIDRRIEKGRDHVNVFMGIEPGDSDTRFQGSFDLPPPFESYGFCPQASHDPHPDKRPDAGIKTSIATRQPRDLTGRPQRECIVQYQMHADLERRIRPGDRHRLLETRCRRHQGCRIQQP
jgi:hypothetical protein